MAMRPERNALRSVLPLVLGLAASVTMLAETSVGPIGLPPLMIPFSIEPNLGHSIQPSLEEAVRRLSDSRCQDVLTDFTDAAGHRLDRNLESSGLHLPQYLGYVVFFDGQGTHPCDDRGILAWTTPGSRAVRICGGQFIAAQRVNAGYTADILIHETLHTLGLGEGPPDSRQITAQVVARCGR